MSTAKERTDPCIELPAEFSERRQETRYRCMHYRVCRVLVRPSFRNISAVLHDVSATGLSLVMTDRLEPGTVLALQLPRVCEGMSCVQSGRVIYVEPDGKGAWLHGCSLGRPLSNPEIASLL